MENSTSIISNNVTKATVIKKKEGSKSDGENIFKISDSSA
jgi:hypothetical protein